MSLYFEKSLIKTNDKTDIFILIYSFRGGVALKKNLSKSLITRYVNESGVKVK